MIVDIIIIAVLIISIAVGIHNGMIVSLVNIFSLIIAIAVSFLLCKPVGNFVIEKTNIDDNIRTFISQKFPMNDTEIKIENTGLPSIMESHIQDAANSVNETKDNIIDQTSSQLTIEIIYVLSFVCLFIIVQLLLNIVKLISRIITKLPILKQINQVGGAILGLAEGVIIVYSVFAVISIISPTLKDTIILEQINNSYIGNQIYNNNILLNKLYKSWNLNRILLY